MGKKKIPPPMYRKQITVRVLERRDKVRDMFLAGCRDQRSMAATLGVSQGTICNDIKALMDQWLEQDGEKTQVRFARRIRQLDVAAFEAYNAFQRSKNNGEQITTSYIPRTCPACKNDEKKKRSCKACEGTGRTTEEIVVKKITGQAGDPAHLRVYLESVKEAAKIEGLHLDKKDQQVLHTHIHARIDWSKVPPDKLLEIKLACDRARLEAMRSVTPAIDTTSENVED